MSDSEALIFRASLQPKVYRDIEIADTGTLYALAQTIIGSFDLDFEHAFGFYSKPRGRSEGTTHELETRSSPA